ncbi:MAG: heme o synthase [Candidatus Binataceae bacterium]
MSTAVLTLEGTAARVRTHAADYLALTKPRVVTMVLFTTLAGFYLAGNGTFDFILALRLLAGTALAAGGTLALNQYIERDLDALMERTRRRPLPEGRLSPAQALAFGAAATSCGLVMLLTMVNALCAATVAATSVVYLFGYTPLKRVSWICNLVGAISGALPPVAGWAAARGSVGAEPIVLFAIMYLWQLPHALAIARLHHRDYARAGMCLLPPDTPRGNPSGRLIVGYCTALVVAGAIPTLMGFAGMTYLFVAVAFGLTFLFYARGLNQVGAPAAAARRVVLASIAYLPAVLLVLVLDKI